MVGTWISYILLYTNLFTTLKMLTQLANKMYCNRLLTNREYVCSDKDFHRNLFFSTSINTYLLASFIASGRLLKNFELVAFVKYSCIRVVSRGHFIAGQAEKIAPVRVPGDLECQNLINATIFFWKHVDLILLI